MLRRWWQYLIGDTIARVERDARAFTAASPERIDGKTAVVFVTAAVCLTAQHFFQSLYDVADLIETTVGAFDLTTGQRWRAELTAYAGDSDRGNLRRWGWWGVITTLTYFVGPSLVIKCGFRERLGDYGLKVHGLFKAWPVYVGMLGVMIPIVYLVSHSRRFLTTYPMYGAPETGTLPVEHYAYYELVYALQFCTLEFFFRGFMVHGTKHRLGVSSVFAMTVAYCMIHFQKPLPECCGSIVAGIALGLMSLKTRSVLLGAALHISVAWTMDGFALFRKGIVIV